MSLPVQVCCSLLLFLAPPGILQSQNLVKNPGFEEFVSCPERLGNFDTDVVGWTAPTRASTDYFHACSTYMGTPENFNGSQDPESGKGYAGLYLYAPGDYREYVQGELVHALEKDTEYEIRFYISLAERSDFSIAEFQVLLAGSSISRETTKTLSKGLLYKEPNNTLTFADLPGNGFYEESAGWMSLSTRITAQGGERYLILGNFRDNRATRVRETGRNAKHGAYYYLDRVGVFPLAGDPAEVPAPQAAFSLGGEALSGVLFDFDDYQLSAAAKTTIHNLYAYMREHPGLRVSVEGHTDSSGPTGYNFRLSELRCLAVTRYLEELGVPEDRLTRVSHGPEKPAAGNDTEAGRQQNRRVVFRIWRQEP